MTEKQWNELKAKLIEALEPAVRMLSEVTAEIAKRIAETERAQEEIPEAPVEAMKEIKAFCTSRADCEGCPFDMPDEEKCSITEGLPFCWKIPGEEEG